MTETDVLREVAESEMWESPEMRHPMYGNGKSKGLAFGKRKKHADWMEKNHKKWLENFSWKVLAIHKLRCRVKCLASESRLMRKEENRASLMYSGILRQHRTDCVRTQARYTQLALAFVRGKPYKSIENDRSVGVNFQRLAYILREFAPACFANLEKELLLWFTEKRT